MQLWLVQQTIFDDLLNKKTKNACILAGTRSGKTVLLQSIIIEQLHRGISPFVILPTSDHIREWQRQLSDIDTSIVANVRSRVSKTDISMVTFYTPRIFNEDNIKLTTCVIIDDFDSMVGEKLDDIVNCTLSNDIPLIVCGIPYTIGGNYYTLDKLYDSWDMLPKHKVYRYSTWDMNPTLTRDQIYESCKFKVDDHVKTWFGINNV